MKTSIKPILDDITKIEITQTLFIEALKNVKREEKDPNKKEEFIKVLMCDNNPIIAAKEAENPSIKDKNLIYSGVQVGITFVNKINNNMKDLFKEIDGLKCENSKLFKESNSLRDGNNKLTYENEKIGKEINSLKDENIKIKGENNNMEKEINSLKEENINLIDKNSSMEKEINNLKDKNSSMEKEINGLKEDNINLKDKNRKLKIEIDGLNGKIDYLIKENNNLKSKMDVIYEYIKIELASKKKKF